MKAVALSDADVMSASVEQGFTKLESAGIGLLLEKLTGYRGIYVQEIVEGGSAWQDGNMLEGDEIKMIDGVDIQDLAKIQWAKACARLGS